MIRQGVVPQNTSLYRAENKEIEKQNVRNVSQYRHVNQNFKSKINNYKTRANQRDGEQSRDIICRQQMLSNKLVPGAEFR